MQVLGFGLISTLFLYNYQLHGSDLVPWLDKHVKAFPVNIPQANNVNMVSSSQLSQWIHFFFTSGINLYNFPICCSSPF